MATLQDLGKFGRDRRGRWLPHYMTDGELLAELAAGTDRAEALQREAAERLRIREDFGTSTSTPG